MGTRVGANIYDVLVRVQTGAVIVRAVDIFCVFVWFFACGRAHLRYVPYTA